MSDISLIKALVDKNEVILVRKPFVRICGGHIQAAMMLSQLLYWTDGKTKIYGKWIAKTSAEWRDELCFRTDYEVKMARNTLESLGLVETEVKKFNGNPTVHYRLMTDVFLARLQEQIRFDEIQQNDLALDDKSITETTSETTNNTADDEKPVVATLPIEWQVLAGVEEIAVPDQKDAQYKDTANLIAMQGFGVDSAWAMGIAYAFMKTRGINIPQSKIKGQRKAVKEMMDMGVAPIQVEEATKQLMDAGMTVTDLYSVAKTAIALANPAPDQNEYHGASEGV